MQLVMMNTNRRKVKFKRFFFLEFVRSTDNSTNTYTKKKNRNDVPSRRNSIQFINLPNSENQREGVS
uniref:Putative ovule protein n=1 Tax=Solanum chacoense TaxID=4108 RepID=A0A0V0HFA9_SOLCH